jgi:hypothetical protein
MLLHIISEVIPIISVTHKDLLSLKFNLIPEMVTRWRDLALFLATQMMHINITQFLSLNIPKIVLLGLLSIWNFAASPINLSVFVKAT